ncbi:MAG: DUF4351 domain-containing protein, partial [Planctomycetales bacterium]|nr:DUF4351 domain-containing protein [Planctomycetales bacterium]
EQVMEIVTSWMKQGIEQGYTQGIEQGRISEGRRLVLRMLRRRLGDIGGDFVARIESLSLDELEDLGEALLHFDSAADLTDWLDRHGPG